MYQTKKNRTQVQWGVIWNNKSIIKEKWENRCSITKHQNPKSLNKFYSKFFPAFPPIFI